MTHVYPLHEYWDNCTWHTAKLEDIPVRSYYRGILTKDIVFKASWHPTLGVHTSDLPKDLQLYLLLEQK